MSHLDHFGGFKRQPKMVEAGDSAVLILKCDSHYHLRYCRTPPRHREQVQFTFFFPTSIFFLDVAMYGDGGFLSFGGKSCKSFDQIY